MAETKGEMRETPEVSAFLLTLAGRDTRSVNRYEWETFIHLAKSLERRLRDAEKALAYERQINDRPKVPRDYDYE